jgi:hypothetical protein
MRATKLTSFSLGSALIIIKPIWEAVGHISTFEFVVEQVRSHKVLGAVLGSDVLSVAQIAGVAIVWLSYASMDRRLAGLESVPASVDKPQASTLSPYGDCKLSAQQIFALFEGKTDMQAHASIEPLIKKSIVISGKVSGVDKDGLVSIDTEGLSFHYIGARITDGQEYLNSLQKGDPITIIGQIETVVRNGLRIKNSTILSVKQ